MKKLLTFIGLAMLAACSNGGPKGSGDMDILQARIDSLQQQLDNAYKPGLGEFMSGIQVHHAKLWFAGSAGNWPLADFEIKEIGEAIEDINAYCTDRPEVASLPVIKPALDSLTVAIKDKSVPQFRSSFLLLTNACNT